MENYMIFAICHYGYAGDIMTIARKAGAKGGTILKQEVRLVRKLQSFWDYHSTRKEMVMIIVPENLKNIMKAIVQNAEFKREFHAITFN